jgi:uncharacterized damage-inducible protein DinB
MMTEVERIADQMRRAYDGDAWHGTPLKKLLEGMTGERAAAHTVAGAHSIWELVLHIAAWQGVVRRRVEGEDAREPEEGDWSVVDGDDDAAWAAALEHLERSHTQLLDALSKLDDARLDEHVGRASLYTHLHGIVQHNLYHAGQIALLKKA